MIRIGLNLAFFLLIGCAIKSSNTEPMEVPTHYRYYNDIDLFQIKGIDELLKADINEPYIRIDSINKNQKDLVFHFDSRTIYKRSYKHNGDYWISSHSVDDREEGATFYFYQFIHGDSIIELEYKHDPFQDGTLQTVRKITRGEILEYDLEDSIKMKPTYEISPQVLRQSIRKRVSSYQIKDKILSFHRQLIDGATSEILSESNDCYVVGRLSYFWWSFVGHRFEKIDC